MDTRDQWTIAGLAEEVASTSRYAGGGAVAAMSLVGAAATAGLVIGLSRRRRDIDPTAAEKLDRLADLASATRKTFLDAIDLDIGSLNELMDAQRALRQARKADDEGAIAAANESLQRAVREAIDIPIDVARDAVQLLRGIDDARAFARAFTMSDLAAAAATTRGAIESLVLMAEVNLGLLEDQEYAARAQQEVDAIEREAARLSQTIIDETRNTIRPKSGLERE
jgi:methenyltetrahydrofolate cyclohydrolase